MYIEVIGQRPEGCAEFGFFSELCSQNLSSMKGNDIISKLLESHTLIHLRSAILHSYQRNTFEENACAARTLACFYSS